MARRDLLERPRHRARIADVDGDGVGSRSDPAGHRRQVLSAARHQHDLGPGAGEGRGDPAAQPAGGAGDDGDLPGEAPVVRGQLSLPASDGISDTGAERSIIPAPSSPSHS